MVWLGSTVHVWFGQHAESRGVIQRIERNKQPGLNSASVLLTNGQEVDIPVAYLDPRPRS